MKRLYFLLFVLLMTLVFSRLSVGQYIPNHLLNRSIPRRLISR